MNKILTAIVTAVVASTISISSAFAHDHDHDHGLHFHSAPGPIVGAGLPFLAVGYGVYWLVRRRRKRGSHA
jgi:hypothetical protein